jgi:hypothetical protein
LVPNPYAPPGAPERAPAPASGGGDPSVVSAVRSTAVLGWAMLGAIALEMSFAWVISAIDFTYIAELQARTVRPWAVSAEKALAWGAMPFRWAAIVMFFVWIYRAASNVRALGRTEMTISPGWCVGWFFIPFANLFMPARAMGEIATASAEDERASRPPAVIAWWIFYVSSSTMQSLHAVVRKGVDLAALVLYDATRNLLATGALVGLFLTVRFIGRGQRYWAHRAASSPGDGTYE